MKNVGLISSVIAHAAIFGVGLISLPAPKTHDVTELEILPIELVSISDVTDVRKGEAKGKPADVVKETTKKAPEPKEPEPKKPEPKPDPVEVPKPKEPAPEKQPEPAPPKVEPEPKPVPVPKPEPAVAPEPESEPEAKVEEPKEIVPQAIAALPKLKPKPPAKPKAPKKIVEQEPVKKRSFDTSALKALANKAEQASPTVNGTDDQQASLGSRTGNQTAAMTQSELDALRAQVAQCWSPPAGAADASQLRVRIEFGLDRQGNVVSGPEPIEFPASKFGVAASESAMRAVRRCAPYSLPADKYDAWSRVRITFDPQEMF
ncbi:cell envelope biogenesis protein TolA [Cohaesibacter celericrescens]|uniref:cell envelope biogenesis protein TolA n=1 Tax=Cohaesibacter celericrescens TaxID=2067669 RepID=UPI003568FBD1